MPILLPSNMPPLTPRLFAVVSLVPENTVFADIGTDHAYIPIYLVSAMICPRGYASDIRKGPLDRARTNIERYGYSDKIRTCLTDGLNGLPLDEIKTVIIAGMGGLTIIEILKEVADQILDGTNILLQPMTDLKEVRSFAFQNQFKIQSEKLALEQDKLYTVMNVVKVNKKAEYCEKDIVIGRYLSDDPFYSLYLRKSLWKYQKAIGGMRKSSQPDEAKISSLKRQLNLFESEAERCIK